MSNKMLTFNYSDANVTGINKYSEIGNVSAVKMESVIQ